MGNKIQHARRIVYNIMENEKYKQDIIYFRTCYLTRLSKAISKKLHSKLLVFHFFFFNFKLSNNKIDILLYDRIQ